MVAVFLLLIYNIRTSLVFSSQRLSRENVSGSVERDTYSRIDLLEFFACSVLLGVENRCCGFHLFEFHACATGLERSVVSFGRHLLTVYDV